MLLPKIRTERESEKKLIERGTEMGNVETTRCLRDILGEVESAILLTLYSLGIRLHHLTHLGLNAGNDLIVYGSDARNLL